jgi:asparagine synthase (glutamine-hydrolysing)
VEFAKSAAEELDLPIRSYTFVDDDLERAIPEVIQAIEEPSPLKLSIGIPMWWAAEKTAEMGFKVMLAGQGADELFGGYKRYVDDYLHHGKERVRELVLKDTANMYETNLERDFKICDSFDVELRLPFVTYKIARFAMEIPIELEMEKTSNTLRKLVLRHVTQDMGLPKSIVNKPKKAIQYTTGVNKALERIAKQKGVPVNEYVQGIFKASRAL